MSAPSTTVLHTPSLGVSILEAAAAQFMRELETKLVAIEVQRQPGAELRVAVHAAAQASVLADELAAILTMLVEARDPDGSAAA